MYTTPYLLAGLILKSLNFQYTGFKTLKNCIILLFLEILLYPRVPGGGKEPIPPNPCSSLAGNKWRIKVKKGGKTGKREEKRDEKRRATNRTDKGKPRRLLSFKL